MKKVILISWVVLFLMILFYLFFERNAHYKYGQDFKRYLKDIHGISENDLPDQAFIIVIPLASCTPCINDLIFNILSCATNKELIFLFVGESFDEDIVDKVRIIETIQSHVYWDVEDKLMYYETNIGSPTFLLMKNKEFYNKTELNNDTFNQLAEKYDF